MEHLGNDYLLGEQLVEYPEDTVVVDLFHRCELTQVAVTGEQRPVVDLGERQRKAVRKRQGRDPGLITQCSLNAVAIQRLNPQPEYSGPL